MLIITSSSSAGTGQGGRICEKSIAPAQAARGFVHFAPLSLENLLYRSHFSRLVLMEQIMGAFGAGRRMPRVSEAQGCCSIDPGRQGSISWCALLNPLLIPCQARPRPAFTSVFIYSPPPFSSGGSEAPGPPLGAGITARAGQGRAGQGSGGCREQPFPCTMPPPPLQSSSGQRQRAALPCQGQGHAAAPGSLGSGIISSGFSGEEMNLSSQLSLTLTHPVVQARHVLLCSWGQAGSCC